jgi:hypothetical protein
MFIPTYNAYKIFWLEIQVTENIQIEIIYCKHLPGEMKGGV